MTERDATPDEHEPGGTHNTMSGNAAHVVQVGSAGAVYLSPPPKNTLERTVVR